MQRGFCLIEFTTSQMGNGQCGMSLAEFVVCAYLALQLDGVGLVAERVLQQFDLDAR